MSHFNLHGSTATPGEFARWHNEVQRLALRTGLGMPVTFSTDPRHAFTRTPGVGAEASCFSQWPEALGLAAIGDEALVGRFADTVRQEYVAVGIRVALHPQVDLATEPRWSRIAGTFGEDADLSSRLAVAYIRGLQREDLPGRWVSAMVKHFPGGGPQKDGEDPHFAYGREQIYPGGNFAYHLRPFEAAIAAGVRQVMPYYGMPVGTEYDAVGFSFNRAVVTGLLRERLGFAGIVCTDWGLVTDSEVLGSALPARAWGVEHLTRPERARMILDAGVDQFGGEACPELIVDLVRAGAVSAERLDRSVRRLLREKFELGLFDQPLVDEREADRVVGSPDFRAAGLDAQRAAMTLLTNHGLASSHPALPLRPGGAFYVEGIEPAAMAAYGRIAPSPDEADLAILRLQAPYEPRTGGLEALFHAGSLAFAPAARERILAICRTVPTVIAVHLDRPAVLPEIVQAAAAVVAEFGACDTAVLQVLFGESQPRGRLPFDLPSSIAAVEASRSDVPFDTVNPLFRFGFGLGYE